MLISQPLFYLVAVPAVLLTGISKGGFGAALGGIAVPLMALVMSPVQAAAIMLPILCFTDVVGFRVYYGKWDTANLRIMLPGALVGIAFGAATFGVVDENRIRILIGSIAVLFVLNNLLGLASSLQLTGRSVIKGTLWSSVSGFTSFVAHAGGPPAMAYLIPQRLDKITFVATANLFFMIVNAIKLVPYAWLGQFSAQNLWPSLLLAPFVPIGVWMGVRMQGKVNQERFYRIVQTAVLATGAMLIYQGLG